MRAILAGLSVALAGLTPYAAAAATKLTPAEIQAAFFNGKVFTAATPSNIRFAMQASADGKITREPVGKSGVKGEGKWTLNKDGFCTEWKGSKAQCFVLVAMGDNKWSVVKGATTVATWSK